MTNNFANRVFTILAKAFDLTENMVLCFSFSLPKSVVIELEELKGAFKAALAKRENAVTPDNFYLALSILRQSLGWQDQVKTLKAACESIPLDYPNFVCLASFVYAVNTTLQDLAVEFAKFCNLMVSKDAQFLELVMAVVVKSSRFISDLESELADIDKGQNKFAEISTLTSKIRKYISRMTKSRAMVVAQNLDSHRKQLHSDTKGYISYFIKLSVVFKEVSKDTYFSRSILQSLQDAINDTKVLASFIEQV